MSRNRTNRPLVAIALLGLAVLALALAACGGGGETRATGDTSADEVEHMDAGDAGQMVADDARDMDADMHDADALDDQVVHVEGDGHELAVHGEVREITVDALDHFQYEPAQVTLQVGQPVRLTLDNTEGVILHDFTIEGLPADAIHSEGGTHGHSEADSGQMEMGSMLHVAAYPGEVGVLEFTPTQPGTFAFYCTVEGHQAAGMEGSTTVLAE